ncbi:MAG TPA: hypothetical protein VMS17_02615 [Gemmataceae bacterium]|nr:hypothetical protein [Gemmataceae bacterium]
MKRFLWTAAAMFLSASASFAFIKAPDPLQGSWSNQLAGGGASTWTFTPLGGGRYDAHEVGMGDARGTAVLTNHHLHIDFVTAEMVGAYDVDLDATGTGGTGQVSFSQGGLTGTVLRAAFRRIGAPAAVRPPADAVIPDDIPEALKPHGGAAGRPGTVTPEPQPLPPDGIIGGPSDPGPGTVRTDDPDGPTEPTPEPPG